MTVFQIHQPYRPEHAEWHVRPISPEKFRQLDDKEARCCYWTREAAVREALVQNRFALRCAKQEVEDIQKQMQELEPTYPNDAKRGVISLAEQAQRGD